MAEELNWQEEGKGKEGEAEREIEGRNKTEERKMLSV